MMNHGTHLASRDTITVWTTLRKNHRNIADTISIRVDDLTSI